MRRLLVLIFTVVVFVMLTSCSEVSPTTIDVSEFDDVIAVNGKVDYSQIYICNPDTIIGGKLEVTEEMIVSCDDLSTVGEKQMIIHYNALEFVVRFTVKYQVDFIVYEEVVSSQLVLDSTELEIPTVSEQDGYKFMGWNPSIPEVINSNLTLRAELVLEDDIVPTLMNYEASYGDTLSVINLPSNSYGYWEFAADRNTLVGNVGLNPFDVRFIPTIAGIEEQTAKVLINVNKKELTFTNVSTQAVYDGNSHMPTFDLSVNLPQEHFVLQVLGGTEMRNVGKYRFAIEIVDENYCGIYQGNFEIFKRDIIVNIDNQNISYGTDLSSIDFTYTVSNLDLDSKLQINIKTEEVTSVGTYDIVASFINDENYNIIVKKGVLTIEPTSLTLEDPTFSVDSQMIYGNKLSSVIFEKNDSRGNWEWVNDDLIIDTPTTYTAQAIFMPNSLNYYPVERSITFDVVKRTLTVVADNYECDYDGQMKEINDINYILFDGEEVFLEPIDIIVTNVSGKDLIDAGSYQHKVIINDARYQGECYTYIVINTISASFDYEYQITWQTGLKLLDIALPENYQWINPNEEITSAGKTSYQARFIAPLNSNYHSSTGNIFVEVLYAKADIIVGEFNLTYDGNAYQFIDIATVDASHAETALTYHYLDLTTNEVVNSLCDAGKYQVTIILPQSSHYAEVVKVVEIEVNKAIIVKPETNITATYEDVLGSITLPSSEYGVFEWVDNKAIVNTPNQYIGMATFIPNETYKRNYASANYEFVVNVSKKQLIIEIVENEFIYNGTDQTLQYIIKDNFGKIYEDIEVISNTATTITNVSDSKTGIRLTINSSYYEGFKDGICLTILPMAIAAPKLVTSTYVYNQNEQVIDFTHFVENWTNLYSLTCFINNTPKAPINAGDYYIQAKLLSDNYIWDGTIGEVLTYDFNITKALANVEWIVDQYTYSGEIFTNYPQAKIMLLDGKVVNLNTSLVNPEMEFKNAGEYEFVSTIMESEINNNYALVNNMTMVHVDKAIVSRPLDIVKQYTGAILQSGLQESEIYTFEEVTLTNVGSVNIIVKMVDDFYLNHQWEGTLLQEVEVLFSVVPKVVNKPKFTNTTFVYTGLEQTFIDLSLVTDYLALNNTGKTVGTYPVTIALPSSNYVWEDNTTDNWIVDFTITHKLVLAPTIISKAYTGDTLVADIPSSTDYRVVENAGGIDKGNYLVKLELTDDNYVWDSVNGVDGKFIELIFEITAVENYWIVSPSVMDWVYDEANSIPLAAAKYGEYIVMYKKASDSDTQYSLELPTSSGLYVARFSVAASEHGDYGRLEATVNFQIHKRQITKPQADAREFIYNGKEHKYQLTESKYYTIFGDVQTNASNYNVTVSLIDENCIWDDNTTEDLIYVFVIKQAILEVTIPTDVKAVYGMKLEDVIVNSEIGIWTWKNPATLVGDKGYNTHYATFTPNDNNYCELNDLAVIVEVSQATTIISDLKIANWVYNTPCNKPTATTNFGTLIFEYATQIDGEYSETVPTLANTYYLRARVEGNENYTSATSLIISFQIQQASIFELDENLTAPLGLTAQYNQMISVVSLPDNQLGVWSFIDDTVILNVFGENFVTLLFTPFDNNYAVMSFENVMINVTAADTTLNVEIPEELVYSGDVFVYSNWFTSNRNNAIIFEITYNDQIVTEVKNAGTYRIKVSIPAPANGYYNEYVDPVTNASYSEFSLTIHPKSYMPNSPEVIEVPYGTKVKDVVINSASTEAIPGTWSWKNVNDTQYVGNVSESLTVVAVYTPTDSINYLSMEVEIELKVIQAVNTVSQPSIVGWVYGEEASVPMGSVAKFGTASYEYSISATSGFSPVVPINAGTYYVRAVVAEDINYQSCVSTAVSFVISKATLTDVIFPSYEGEYYEDRFNASVDYTSLGSASYQGTPVEGEFILINPVYGANQSQYEASGHGYQTSGSAISSNYQITFKPTSANYAEVTSTVEISLLPVAYNGNYYYGTVEKALNDANTISSDSGKTIYIIIGSNPIINTNCEIKSGVTLMMQHTQGVDNDSTPGGYSDTNLPPDWFDGEVTNTLYLNENVILTNNGTLEIGGILSAGGGYYNASGQTTTLWTEIRLKQNAEIVSNGLINCYGYIKDYDKTHQGIVTANQGSVYMPFVLRDFIGGSNSYAIYNSINTHHASLFNVFEFRNIQSKFHIAYNATLYSWANIYAGDKVSSTTTEVIGLSTKSLIQLTDSSYSYAETKYDEEIEVLDLNIYGGAKINSIELKVEVIPVILSISASTKNVFFPISHHLNISLNQNINQTVIAEFSIPQQIKLLTGSKLTVEKGARLTVDTLTIYSEFDESDSSMNKIKYPSNLPAAQLIVNGELVANDLAGMVSTTSESGAKLTINNSGQIKSYEPKTYTGATLTCAMTGWYIISEKLKLRLFNGIDVNDDYTQVAIGTYVSRNGGWYSEKVTLYYDANGGILNSNDVDGPFETGDGYIIRDINVEDPTREYHTFTGWYLDPEGTISAIGEVLYASAYIYAGWSANEYEVLYKDVYVSNSSVESEEKSLMLFDYNTNEVLIDPVNDDYVFGGWYTDLGYTKRITNIIGSEIVELLTDDKAIIYALWYPTGTESYKVYYNPNSYTTTCPTEISFVVMEDSDWSKTELYDLSTRDLVTSETKYFGGWYSTSDFKEGTLVETLSSDLFVNNTLYIYALWLDKVELTVKQHVSPTTGAEATVQATGIFYKPGQTISISTLKSLLAYEEGEYTLTEWVLTGGVTQNNESLAYNTSSVTLVDATTLTAIIKKVVSVTFIIENTNKLKGTISIKNGYSYSYNASTGEVVLENNGISASKGEQKTLTVTEDTVIKVNGNYDNGKYTAEKDFTITNNQSVSINTTKKYVIFVNGVTIS